ncbi:MAG: hypothetical protein M1827_006574 [Pycnora praestabilis]|nr:MAG: hypothetical protein M1827_006574 [Pycnora praestabilis]
MESPYKLATDSPSKQLLSELGRLRINADEGFYARLERETSEREKIHRLALAAAAVEHERVRESAEVARERFQLELDQERKRRDEEERLDLDRKRQEKADRELEQRRREIGEARKEEAERKKLADAAREKKELDRRKLDQEQKQKRETEAARQKSEKENAEKTGRERREAIQNAAPVPLPQPACEARPLPPAPSPALPQPLPRLPTLKSSTSEKELAQQQYVEIHKRLKQLRKFMVQQSKQNPNLKERMGDMRREIKKCLGQLTEGKGANQGSINKIVAILKEASTLTEPAIDILQFIYMPSSQATPEHPTSDGPALLVYLINILSKAIIAQFISEASVSPRAADPIGIVASTIFANNDFRFHGRPLIDILLAKFRVVCPVLWGIAGDEKTNSGKLKLGWWREEPGGPFVSEQRHSERMTGLGAGFASLALRNFQKSRLENPYPNSNYWTALACVINTPPEQAGQTHYVILKAMTEGYENRFLEFYGHAALVALRKALVEFPKHGVEISTAAKALSILPDVLKKDKKLTLVG